MKDKMGGFFERVYEVVRKVPSGKVVSYGEIARVLGTKDARRVGHALHANPYEGEVPCHRVVSREGRVAQNFAFDGPGEQILRLKAEGVGFISLSSQEAVEGRDEVRVDMEKYRYEFSD